MYNSIEYHLFYLINLPQKSSWFIPSLDPCEGHTFLISPSIIDHELLPLPDLFTCAHQPLWAHPCHHVTALSSFLSSGALNNVQSPTLYSCTLVSLRYTNYFSWYLLKYLPQFSYFIIVTVTLWSSYAEPVILQNGGKTLCSLFDVWFSRWHMLFLPFHICLHCPVLDVYYYVTCDLWSITIYLN